MRRGTMERKHVFITLLILAVLFLSACDVPFGNRPLRPNPERQYYAGTEGVMMKFSDLANPPARMYYHSDMAPTENTFNVFVDLHNVGSSYTYGAVFVSGYDPGSITMYDEEGLPLGIARYGGTYDDCTIDFGLFGPQAGTGNFWDTASAVFNCANSGVGGYYSGSNDFGLRIDSIGEAFGWDSSFWDTIGFTYDNNAAGNRLRFNVDNANLDYLNNGRGVIVALSGLSFRQYNGQEYYLQPDLPDYPGGEQTTKVFQGQIRDFPVGTDELRVPLQVTNCYLYASYISTSVCIDPDPYSTNDKACYPREHNFAKGKGAPIVATSIRQEDISNRGTWFTIQLRNTHEGRGTIFDMGYLEQCSPYHPNKRHSPQILNKIYLVDARVGNTHLQCTPDRFRGIRLDNGRGELRCYYPFEYETAGSGYETQLTLEFAYGYSESIQRDMTIKRAY